MSSYGCNNSSSPCNGCYFIRLLWFALIYLGIEGRGGGDKCFAVALRKNEGSPRLICRAQLKADKWCTSVTLQNIPRENILLSCYYVMLDAIFWALPYLHSLGTLVIALSFYSSWAIVLFFWGQWSTPFYVFVNLFLNLECWWKRRGTTASLPNQKPRLVVSITCKTVFFRFISKEKNYDVLMIYFFKHFVISSCWGFSLQVPEKPSRCRGSCQRLSRGSWQGKSHFCCLALLYWCIPVIRGCI